MTGLDEILTGSTPARDAPPPAQAPAEPAPQREAPPPPAPTPGDDRQVDFGRRSADPAPPPEPAAPPAAETQEPDQVPISALRDERKKRQAAEAELQRRMAAYEAQVQQPAPQVNRPDLFEDPDGALNYVQHQFQQQLTRTRLDMSVAMAKTQFQDYEQAEAAFVDAVKANPTLYDQMLNDPHPAGFAYRVGKQVEALREIGSDPNAYKTKIRQELEAELRKQIESEQRSGQAAVRSSIPPSLAAARDTNGRFAPGWSGAPPLKDILAPRK